MTIVLNIQNGFNKENTVVISIMKDINMITYPRNSKWVTSDSSSLNDSGVIYPVANVILTNENIQLDAVSYRHFYKIVLMKI